MISDIVQLVALCKADKTVKIAAICPDLAPEIGGILFHVHIKEKHRSKK